MSYEATNYKPDTDGVTSVWHDDNISVTFHSLPKHVSGLWPADDPDDEAIAIALWERLVAKGTFAR